MSKVKLSQIKSIFNLKNIISYINNDSKIELFYFSKYFQNKLELKVLYEEKYLQKKGFNISNYLYTETYNKDYLNTKYQEFISNNNVNQKELEDSIYYVLENLGNINKNLKKENSRILINIDSPLFKIISKTKNFEDYYIINIYEDNVDKNYKLCDDNLNNSNINYNSICYTFKNITKLHFLNQLKIEINKIKSLKYKKENKDKKDVYSTLFEKIKNFRFK